MNEPDDPIWLGEERLDALEASARQTVRRRAKLELFRTRGDFRGADMSTVRECANGLLSLL